MFDLHLKSRTGGGTATPTKSVRTGGTATPTMSVRTRGNELNKSVMTVGTGSGDTGAGGTTGGPVRQDLSLIGAARGTQIM